MGSLSVIFSSVGRTVTEHRSQLAIDVDYQSRLNGLNWFDGSRVQQSSNLTMSWGGRFVSVAAWQNTEPEMESTKQRHKKNALQYSVWSLRCTIKDANVLTLAAQSTWKQNALFEYWWDVNLRFYREMLRRARLWDCMSTVCLPVTSRYRDQIGWNSSKII